MTITEFLEARIAEDEAAARAAQPPGCSWYTERRDVLGRQLLQGVAEGDPDFDEDVDVFTAATRDHAAHIARHDPARVLAECEAKRRVVEKAQAADSQARRAQEMGWQHTATRAAAVAYIEALLLLALPYAEHPDYDEEWKP